MNVKLDHDPVTGRFLKGHQARKTHAAFTNVRQEATRRRVRRAKAGWVADIGPTRSDLTTSQRILIEKSCFLLERTMCVEEWIRDHPELYGKMLTRGLRDTYLAWCNTLRLTLRELGIDKRQGPKVMTEKEYLDRIEYPESPQSGGKE